MGSRLSTRVGRAKRLAGRLLRASAAGAKEAGRRQVGKWVSGVSILMRHPELMAGEVSPALVQEVLASGGTYLTPRDAMAVLKRARDEYGRSTSTTDMSGIGAFGELFEEVR